MGLTTRCRKCGVPVGVSRNLEWLSNGTIAFKLKRSHRIVLLESDNLDGLFANLEKMVERPLEEVIVDSKARATRDFLRFALNRRTGWAVYLLSYLPVRKFVADLCRVMGYGRIDLHDISPRFRRATRMTMRASNIYSLPLLCGDFKGAAEMIEGKKSAVDYVLEDRGNYIMTVYNEGEELPPREEDLIVYSDKPGDIEWKRCPGCGVPLVVGQFLWNLTDGVITNTASGRRMAIYGPSGVDLVFQELERELERPVDGLAVEAQRLFAHTFLDKRESIYGYHSFRDLLAVRGLGNLVGYAAGQDGLELRIENPCLKPFLIGLVQAGYEVATGRAAEAAWETTPGGDLLLRLK